MKVICRKARHCRRQCQRSDKKTELSEKKDRTGDLAYCWVADHLKLISHPAPTADKAREMSWTLSPGCARPPSCRLLFFHDSPYSLYNCWVETGILLSKPVFLLVVARDTMAAPDGSTTHRGDKWPISHPNCERGNPWLPGIS
jgi:hypothetical protein